jgi:hypothetical protein
MTSDPQDSVPTNAGSSTDQHVTGAPETGTFTTDKAPTADTPVHGSSNAGINVTRANRVSTEGDAGETVTTDESS